MSENKKREPFEVKRILEKMDAETLVKYSAFADTPNFVLVNDFCKRYALTKKGDVLLELNAYDPVKLAIDVSFRKGEIYSLGSLIDVISGSKKELLRRKED